MDFGYAIKALKEGKLVTRDGWNGKGMYLKLIQGWPIDTFMCPMMNDGYFSGTDMGHGPQKKAGQLLNHIMLKTSGDSEYWGEGYSDFIPWTPSQSDILAEDWIILNN